MLYFAPGVIQAEGKAFSPSEQTRNASLWCKQHEKLNDKTSFVFLEANSELNTELLLDTPCCQRRLQRRVPRVTQLTRGPISHCLSRLGSLKPACRPAPPSPCNTAEHSLMVSHPEWFYFYWPNAKCKGRQPQS